MERKLQRRPFLGVKMGDPGHEFGDAGLVVAGARTRSMAERAGLAPGDEITAISGVPITSMAALREAMGALIDSSRATITARRGADTFSSEVEVCRWPREELDGHRVIYDQVDVGAVRLRTIITEPDSGGPHPSVLFLQGIRRGTVDLPMSPQAPLRLLIGGLARRGFATMRLERRGVGDSEGGPFEELDLATEVSDVEAALAALAASSNIDRDRIALFGHSTGGMIAPLVAGEASAVVVYGTASSSWFDCIRASARHQIEVNGQRAEADRILAELERGIAMLASDDAASMFGRGAAFHRQLDAADLGAAWTTAISRVLVLHGQYDWVVSEDDAGALVELLGRGDRDVTFEELEGLDHAMTWHPSKEDSVSRYGAGRFDGAIVDRVAGWLAR